MKRFIATVQWKFVGFCELHLSIKSSKIYCPDCNGKKYVEKNFFTVSPSWQRTNLAYLNKFKDTTLLENENHRQNFLVVCMNSELNFIILLTKPNLTESLSALQKRIKNFHYECQINVNLFAESCECIKNLKSFWKFNIWNILTLWVWTTSSILTKSVVMLFKIPTTPKSMLQRISFVINQEIICLHIKFLAYLWNKWLNMVYPISTLICIWTWNNNLIDDTFVYFDIHLSIKSNGTLNKYITIPNSLYDSFFIHHSSK